MSTAVANAASGSRAFDYTLPDPPTEPVSSLTFNPNPDKANQLLVASWDKAVRLYHLPTVEEEQASSSSQAIARLIRLEHTFPHDAAVLDVCWISDTLAASCGVDRRVRLLNLQTGQGKIIGKHENAISRVRYSHATNLLFTCSWDATLKVWDPSPSSPALLHTIPLPDKALAMDIAPPFPFPVSRSGTEHPTHRDVPPRLVVGLAGRINLIYRIDRWQRAVQRIKEGSIVETSVGRAYEAADDADHDAWKPEQKRESSLKFMLRDVRCMPSGTGYALSSVEGRIAVEFFDPSADVQKEKYAFKCHRQVVDGVDTVYPVNAISFHPVHGTFASLGGDAVWSVWDAAAKKRIRQYPRLPSPLSAGAMSSDGARQAVASGFENIKDAADEIDGEALESGSGGQGSDGKVQIHIRTDAWEECRPKSKA